MGTWQTLLDVCPYIPIPLMAILFALGLWHEIVRSNRRIAADIKPPRFKILLCIRLNPRKGIRLKSPITP